MRAIRTLAAAIVLAALSALGASSASAAPADGASARYVVQGDTWQW
ncbi:hypothetical protein [Knoellia subterranea]|uniref:Uncharacterized protein n=1 Tax=Knoellia subterranea KCTC 19937 TaxID=1385521 RepID=A0A0A0JU69_9MICO|nr:hypothetical protein [Knoellia subterranea]KGN39617.1 hypothetical protein N803_02510 [Knoellia subterranea KCTC 19937]